MAPNFSEILRQHLERHGLSGRAFAIKAGSSRATVSQVLNGGRRVPPEVVYRWADVFDLQGDERETFVEEALLTGASPELEAHVRSMRSRLMRTERPRSKQKPGKA